mgnify:CR=1 FL=1
MIQNTRFLDSLKSLDKQEGIKDYLFVLYGKLDQEMTITAVQLIEKKMKLESFGKSLITRTKMISIEILQNIVKHQENHDEIFPYFALGTDSESLTIMSGNVVTRGDKEIITNKLKQFIDLDESTIREKYKNAIKNSKLTSEGNAGIGLFDIVYRSNKNLTFTMDNLSDNLFSFNLNVSIN